MVSGNSSHSELSFNLLLQAQPPKYKVKDPLTATNYLEPLAVVRKTGKHFVRAPELARE